MADKASAARRQTHTTQPHANTQQTRRDSSDTQKHKSMPSTNQMTTSLAIRTGRRDTRPDNGEENSDHGSTSRSKDRHSEEAMKPRSNNRSGRGSSSRSHCSTLSHTVGPPDNVLVDRSSNSQDTNWNRRFEFSKKQMSPESIKREMVPYVKNIVFPKIKFLDPETMEFSEQKNSL